MPDDEAEDDEVPGRSWLRLAAVVGASMLLLLAVVVAFNLGRGAPRWATLPEDDARRDHPGHQPSASAAPLADRVTATDFDPQGDPPEENPELAPLAVDGDPATAWRTRPTSRTSAPAASRPGSA